MPGPKPTPTSILAARGSWRANTPGRLNEAQPPASATCPKPPATLSPEGKKLWKHFAQPLHVAGLLTDADVQGLALLVERMSDVHRLREKIADEGEITLDRDGNTRRNPLTMLHKAALEDAIKLLREFGLSPSSRVGLPASKPTAPSTNPHHPGFFPNGRTKFAKG